MLQTIFVIVISVTIFGVLFFLYVKKVLKKRLNYYLSENRKRNEIVNRAYLHIHEKHTWKKRINQLMQYS